MSTYSFTTTSVPDSNGIAPTNDTEVPERDDVDRTPEISHAYHCQYCSTELTYSGRGRKPKYCTLRNGGNADCIKKNGKGGLSAPKTRGRNAEIAAQATDILVQANRVLVLGASVVGYYDTGAAINDREEVFREQAYNALILDPKLCRTILGVGVGSGKVALVIAYGMLAVSVYPIAIGEYREKRNVRRVESDAV